jgi:hypothetical protein
MATTVVVPVEVTTVTPPLQVYQEQLRKKQRLYMAKSKKIN